MADKGLIFDKIRAIESDPEGRLIFKNNNLYFDHFNLTWLGRDIIQEYGASAGVASKFNPLYGLIGKEAKAASAKPFSISKKDIQILFKVSVRMSIQEVSGRIGNGVFHSLPKAVQAVLVSLYRQFESLDKTMYPALAMSSRMLARGHVKQAIRYLGDKNGWPSENGKVTLIRQKAVTILEGLLKEGK
jgi:hypothetical protein